MEEVQRGQNRKYHEEVRTVELVSDVKNLVLMVGTNNLKNDGTSTTLNKYEELIRTAKEKSIRNVTD